MGSWTPGKVALELGISPVTLRTWSARYGVGPIASEDGGHRRFSDADIRRFRHMRRLIDRGMRPREAATTAFGAAPPPVSVTDSVRELGEAAEQMRFASIAALLDEAFRSLGPAGAWTDVIVPVLRHLEDRWLRGDVCFESEWALTSEVSLALQRYSASPEQVPPERPVLLACCPHERHSLPMEVLRAALVEIGLPALFLGQMAPAEMTMSAAARLAPSVVLLWAMSASTADDVLAQRLKDGGSAVVTAGPGWERLVDHRGDRDGWVGDLSAALDAVQDRCT
ncbi:MerR family transcriptional regulator [Amycolatopsis sp. cmx-11-12]|uniref:MerR family transcriptional regulator n=1 Tax=Amycolatopsis sp. cmx-11-12 TaxID=2785795 RepID=UPI0039182B5F